ncbi:hypothetical protein, partial [Dysosmobacter sp.]|uniref:hypothetical protein n=1 Tax=Dysosmobacter sp. TaxID=2591382 RepID=UPI003AB1E4DC
MNFLNCHKKHDFLTDNTNFRTHTPWDSLYNKSRDQPENGDVDDASNKPENESSDPASRHR